MRQDIPKTMNFDTARMKRLFDAIAPLPRMVNSPGLDTTFEIISKEFPDIILHEYPVGSECEDWIVPPAWEVCGGWMKNESGELIASTDENLLFVAPYSKPVDGWFTKDEIISHLRTRPEQPDAFILEHRLAYNYRLKTWGISLPHNRWSSLPDGRYHIKIEVKTHNSPLKTADLFLPGERPETLCICAHIDELCNDDLSGCVAAMELMHFLQSLPRRNYSYQMLLVPEMFGTLFYLYHNREKVAKTIGMLNLETLGDGREWCLKGTHPAGHSIEQILRMALRQNQTKACELNFFEGYGNDERYFAWPTINLPGVALQRYPYDKYHSSLDTPDKINMSYMKEALAVCKIFIEILETNSIPAYTRLLPPWLTRHDLYVDVSDNPASYHKLNDLALYHIDGHRSILELAQLADLNFSELKTYLDRFEDEKLIAFSPVNWKLK